MSNAYLEKKRARDKVILDIGMQCGKQQMADYLTIALRDPDVVGSDVFGKERIQRVLAAMERLDREFAGAYTVDVEADHVQSKLDRMLAEVYGDELVPFPERQPYIKQFGYEKSRKGWK